MKPFSLFISYSHEDEWLKSELIQHLAALKRSGVIDVWHDRMIPAGGLLDSEIDGRVQTSDIFLFLISASFINSDYCYKKEYQAALARHKRGEAEIVPVVVRDCDWDVGDLKTFNALPPDAAAVTRNAPSRSDNQQRDASWLKVIEGLKFLVSALKKKLEPPQLLASYAETLFRIDFIRHPQSADFDEEGIFVDPDLYFENEKEQISSLARLCDVCQAYKAVIFTGKDRSGKTLMAKMIQLTLLGRGTPVVIINGRLIKNPDLRRTIETALTSQFGLTQHPRDRFLVILDDFDECTLPDAVKERLVKFLSETYLGCLIFSFSNASAVLFSSDELPSPAVISLNPLADEKVLQVVRNWRQIGLPDTELVSDNAVLATFERVQMIFRQTELDKSPYTVVTFLELLELSGGTDIAFSSFAACYDTLITTRLNSNKVDWKSFDEAKNFLSLIAYKSYSKSGTASLSKVDFKQCLDLFEEQYLSSSKELSDMSTRLFLRDDDTQYSFIEEYLWFFLCARYVVKVLQLQDRVKYTEFVETCARNIFQKKYANIVIYIAYFSNENLVLDCLLKTVDGLFSKADSWVLSDDTRELMLGIASRDSLLINSSADIADNRVFLLREKISDIIEDAEKVVAKYTLPFLNSRIDDSSYVEAIDEKAIDADSYMKSVNALLRIHSVIGQILAGRTGTFGSSVLLDCISRMVRASGRYASLNHAIATVLLYDKETSLAEAERAIDNDKLSADEKYEKVLRIFAFWSVYLSHAGLARYLCQEHSIRALERLARESETEVQRTEKGNVPFNFHCVLLIAKLYHSGTINYSEIEHCIRLYGDTSSLVSILRVVVHMYAYYMPLSIGDKQWVSQKLHMPLRRIESQRIKATGLKNSWGRSGGAQTGISAKRKTKSKRVK